MRAGFDEIRARLPLRDLAEREGLKVKPWAGGVQFDCPVCRKGARNGKGARARDGVTWRCMRCKEGGDVVDLLRLSRGLDGKAAFREACELAGIDRDARQRGGETSPAERREEAARDAHEALDAGPTVDPEDLAERLRAVRLAAGHYSDLADLLGLEAEGAEGGEERWGRDERMDMRTHVDGLAEFDREGFGAAAVRSRDGYLVLADLEADIAKARAYLMQRLGAAWPEVRPLAGELIGICPRPDSGLATWLRFHGGERLLEAAKRTDLFGADGGERFAGMLVYQWHDERGRVVYLTGRAVPGLYRGNPKAKLCPRAPHNNVAGFGLPLPDRPFGAFLADQAEGPIWIVEGELDALQGLLAGPTVATGGVGRMGGTRGVEAIKRWLDGREAVVRFDEEADPVKRAEIDRRAMGLARAVGCRVYLGRGDGGIAEGDA